jgi:hypothetical protein
MPEQDGSKGPTEQIQNQSVPTKPIRTDEAEVVPSAHSAHKENNHAKDHKPKWTDRTMAFFTVFLFLAAVIQAVIFFKQWQEMHTGGTDTHDLALAAKSQADETKAQVEKMNEGLTKTDKLIAEATAQATSTKILADDTLKQAKATRDLVSQSTNEGRPWLGVTITVSDFEAGKESKVGFLTTNSGKRPAKLTGIHLGGNEYKEFPKEPTFGSSGFGGGSTVVIVPGSGSGIELIIPKGFTDEANMTRLNAASIGDLHFFVYERVDYEDVITHTTHWTKTCMMYHPKTDSIAAGFAYCSTYNDAN